VAYETLLRVTSWQAWVQVAARVVLALLAQVLNLNLVVAHRKSVALP